MCIVCAAFVATPLGASPVPAEAPAEPTAIAAMASEQPIPYAPLDALLASRETGARRAPPDARPAASP